MEVEQPYSLPIPIPVNDGGTGVISLSPYALLAGGITSNSALQQIAGLGTSGQVLVSNGILALPTWQSLTTGVSSVSNSDGTLTISPTTGAVISSLNLAHANTWSGLQTFNPGTLGNPVQVLTTTTTNDDPIETIYQQKVTTTDATVTTLATIAIPASTTVMIEARVVARRTGGSAGTAEDGASYIVVATYKNVSGTATEIGETSVFTAEDQAGWNTTFTPSSSNALLQVQGSVNNNISWAVTYRVYSIGT